MANEITESEESWVSLGRVVGWLWVNLYTRLGALLLAIACLSIGAYQSYQTEKYWVIFYSPVWALPIGFGLFLLMLLTTMGDFFAIWAMSKLFKLRNPKSFFHQFLYFCFSCVGLLLAFALANIGSVDGLGYRGT